MNSLAIITARGGSKRVPHKNIRDFCGKPIIAYSIQAALESNLFEEVMVSTDDKAIADIAVEYGAVVPFMRSEKNANDFATTSDVLLEVLESYASMNRCFAQCCCIYPTAPFVTPEKLKKGMELLLESGCDCVMPVVQFSYPPQRAVHFVDGRIMMLYPENEKTRSQDLEPIYHDCGQFYCLKVDSFQKQKTLLMQDTRPLILPETEVQDVDTFEDWKLAELKFHQAGNPAYRLTVSKKPLILFFWPTLFTIVKIYDSP